MVPRDEHVRNVQGSGVAAGPFEPRRPRVVGAARDDDRARAELAPVVERDDERAVGIVSIKDLAEWSIRTEKAQT